MTKLKPYQKHQGEIVSPNTETLPSGVACDELKCKGEMMIAQPTKKHPELKGLRRAQCNRCKWLGWV